MISLKVDDHGGVLQAFFVLQCHSDPLRPIAAMSGGPDHFSTQISNMFCDPFVVGSDEESTEVGALEGTFKRPLKDGLT